MRSILSSLFLVLLAAGPSLMAQTTPFDVQGALVLANDDLKKVTHTSALGGLTLGAGYNMQAFGSQIPLRLSLNTSLLPGKAYGTIKTSLSLLQMAADVHVATPLDKLSATVGLSLNKYSVRNTGTPSDPISDVGNSSVIYNRYDWAVATGKGLKFGARLGLDYRISPAFSAVALLQMTELGNGSYGPVNPSWIELGARWHF